MSIIPSYLTCVERQFDGYPSSVTNEQKIELENAVRQLLLQHDFLSMSQIYHRLNDSVDVLKKSCVWDFSYACIHRALASLADEVFTLSYQERLNEKYRIKEEKLSKLPIRYESLQNNKLYHDHSEPVKWFYSNSMISAFPNLFQDCTDNIDVENKLRKLKIIHPKSCTDSESCQFLILFSSLKSAKAFVDRFNHWAVPILNPKKLNQNP